MGRITLFVSDGCGHCLRAKQALKERSIPFEEISIVDHPGECIEWMIQKVCVPQQHRHRKRTM
jgi:glutaredoxin